MVEIQTALEGWQPRGGLMSYRAYAVFRDQNVLPFAGGYLEQPAWWLDDVACFQLLEEFYYLNDKLPDVTLLPDYESSQNV